MFAALARWIGITTMFVGVVGVVLLLAGFFWFVGHIATEVVPLNRNADGIVVLTGAATRIPDAMELLASERGKRLLITGVHSATTSKEIARVTPLYSKYINCCIDLDRSALNTFGNAIETKRWAHKNSFNSLIIVTSNWHMPRALVEINHQLPEIALIPYPVVSEHMKSGSWWLEGDTVRLLIGEYFKYLFALVRFRLDPDTAV